jgi:hypothetical protein
MKFAKVLIAVLACTSLLIAQEAAAPKAAKGAKKEAAASISGTFVSADAVANTIVVKVGKKDDTLAVDASAKVISGKDTIQLGAIPADSKVTISTKMVDGKKVATKISVKAAAAAKAGKAKKVEKKTVESSTTTTTTEPAATPAPEAK